MSSPRHLLMTVDAVGGVWSYALDLARGLVPHGYVVTLALLGPSAGAAQRDAVAALDGVRLVETGLPLDWLSPDSAAVGDTGRALASLAERLGADVVQLNQPALAAEARFAMPVLAVAHSCVATWWGAVKGGPLPADLAWQAELTGAGLRAADAAACPSAAFGRALAATYGIAAPVTIHNGRAPMGCVPAAMHDFAFTAGRLWDEGKDAATLDRAAARLAVPVKAAGPLVGPHGQRFDPQHVHALGQVEAGTLSGCLSARPVFVSAARYEPFGLAVLEGAQAGCALVLSDIPTFRELWDGAALFMPSGDAPAFADAIESLVLDQAARLALGDRAKARAAAYTVEAMASGTASLLARLVPARKVAA